MLAKSRRRSSVDQIREVPDPGSRCAAGQATQHFSSGCGIEEHGCAPTPPPKNTQPDERLRAKCEPRSSAASSGTSPEKSTASSPTRHQPRTAPGYAADANNMASPSPRPPELSEPTPAVSQHSSSAETTTTNSLPAINTGLLNNRLANHRSIVGFGLCCRCGGSCYEDSSGCEVVGAGESVSDAA